MIGKFFIYLAVGVAVWLVGLRYAARANPAGDIQETAADTFAVVLFWPVVVAGAALYFLLKRPVDWFILPSGYSAERVERDRAARNRELKAGMSKPLPTQRVIVRHEYPMSGYWM